MKNAIIIHGMPGEVEYHAQGDKAAEGFWVPWIVEELKKAGIDAHNPEMPEPYAPDYKKWCAVFEQYPIDENTILVGHSAGGGFLVRWLSENKSRRVGKVALVAPWIDPHHAWAPKMFNDLVIDEELAGRTAGVTELISLDDEQDELDTLEILKKTIKGLQVKQFTDRGHFLVGEIPELRDTLLI